MAQQETEQLTRILNGAALSRAVSTIAELGVSRVKVLNQVKAAAKISCPQSRVIRVSTPFISRPTISMEMMLPTPRGAESSPVCSAE